MTPPVGGRRGRGRARIRACRGTDRLNGSIHGPNDLADRKGGARAQERQPLVAESVQHQDGFEPLPSENQTKNTGVNPSVGLGPPPVSAGVGVEAVGLDVVIRTLLIPESIHKKSLPLVA